MTTADQISLAHASAFRLGPIKVEPALRQITGTRFETLAPRVMQVLVVPAMANACRSRCAVKANCTASIERRIKRWEHETVIEAM